MAQNVLDYSYDPTGNELMDEYLPKMAENCLTNNSGIARPTYAVENTVWVDTSDDDTWRYKIYDGTSDIVLFELDNITKKINFPNITGLFRFKGSVATVSALPATGNLPGDVYNVIDGGANYAWDDSEWDKLSENLEWGRIVGTLSNQTDLQNALNAKQPTLVSGTNIKTVNGNSLLGSGDVNIDSLPTQTGQAGKFLTTNGTNASWAQVDALPSQTGQAGKFLTTDGSLASWAQVDVNAVSRNIGEIIQSTIPLSDAGLHLLDGALINGAGSYSAFVTYIAGLVANYPDLFTTETNWQQAVTDYGVCGKFVYDSTNNTVRLPKITGFTEGTTDVTALGDLIQAGLPNIEGEFKTTQYRDEESGAFYRSNTGGTFLANGSSYPDVDVAFDASRSSSIYGNSTTVQPQAIKVLYYIVIANSVKTNIEVDIDEVMTDLNAKVDKADLSPVQCVVETYVNGSSWYRIWSDGWIEQGGFISMYSSNSKISLLQNYTNIDYNILVSFGGTSYREDAPAIHTKTTSSFKVAHNAGLNNGFGLYWYACGYGA